MARRILVTGAASGLGRAIAERFARAGDRVLVTDVDADRGAEVAGGLPFAAFRRLDVTSAADWSEAVTWCEQAWDGLDVLVNNAGVAAAGRFERITAEDWDWIMAINLGGVVNGCRAVVPLFKRQQGGHIVNVASMAGLMNLPVMSSYNVSKAGVISLSETLRNELRPYGVGVTVVCPSFFATNLMERFRTPDPVAGSVMQKLARASTVTAADVAKQVVDAVDRRRFLVVTHSAGRRALWTKRLVPRLAEREVDRFWTRMRPALEREDTGAANEGTT